MRQIYNMVDGIPIWQHLKIGSDENKIRLIGADFGKFAEIIGRRVLNELTEKGGILGDIFPGINIINIQRPSRIRIVPNAKIEIGDLILEIDYKNGIKFGKKIIVFEIKHGRFQIEQNQIRRYASMVNNPGEFFSKADELRVIFVMLDKIDTVNGSASYHIRELDKTLATKILESMPLKHFVEDNTQCSGVDDSSMVDYNISEGLKWIME